MTEYPTHGGHGRPDRPVKRLTFDVPPELHAAVKERAAQSGESMSDLFRLWVCIWLGVLPPGTAPPLAVPDPPTLPPRPSGPRTSRTREEERHRRIAQEAVADFYASRYRRYPRY